MQICLVDSSQGFQCLYESFPCQALCVARVGELSLAQTGGCSDVEGGREDTVVGEGNWAYVQPENALLNTSVNRQSLNWTRTIACIRSSSSASSNAHNMGKSMRCSVEPFHLIRAPKKQPACCGSPRTNHLCMEATPIYCNKSLRLDRINWYVVSP